MENYGPLMVLSAVIVVGVISAIGLTTTQSTGAALTSQPGCWCKITPYTPYDHGLGDQYYGASQVQFIAAHAGVSSQITDSWCQNRCEIMYRRNNNVVGQAAPFGSIRQPVV